MRLAPVFVGCLVVFAPACHSPVSVETEIEGIQAPRTSTSGNTLVMTLDGQVFAHDTISATWGGARSIPPNFFALSASGGTAGAFALGAPDRVGVHKTRDGLASAQYAVVAGQSWRAQFGLGDGEIVVESVGASAISGRFEVTLVNPDTAGASPRRAVGTFTVRF